VTRRRFVLGWTGFCAAGWLVVGGLAEANEERCRAADGYLCFAPGAALVIAGVGAVAIWVVGGLIAWAVSTTRRSDTAAELRVPAQSHQREIREDE
jgi:hypothetical protein